MRPDPWPEGRVLLTTARPTASERRTFLFEDPEEVWSGAPGDFSWDRLREMGRAGLVAGYLSWDLGAALAGCGGPTGPMPSFWFGRYGSALVRDERRGAWSRLGSDGGRAEAGPPGFPSPRAVDLRFLGFDMGRESYLERVESARGAIADGHYYQVNLTLRGRFAFGGDPHSLLCALLGRQPVPFGALVPVDGGAVVSASPELFLGARRGRVWSCPMKGTAPALPGARRRLCASAKDRAENLMIADLVRNDLGRVASGVRVRDLFRVERYATVLQMVSRVEADLLPAADLWDALASAFPPGSVSGAPKSSALEAIGTLEASPRGVYTGVIGYAFPWGEARFSVAIRTAQVFGGDLLYGTGGGITYASDGGGEWEECLLKMKVLEESAGR